VIFQQYSRIISIRQLIFKHAKIFVVDSELWPFTSPRYSNYSVKSFCQSCSSI